VWQAARKIWAEEGPRAYWKGNGVNVVRIFPYSAGAPRGASGRGAGARALGGGGGGRAAARVAAGGAGGASARVRRAGCFCTRAP
jgi:hypothetical protein